MITTTSTSFLFNLYILYTKASDRRFWGYDEGWADYYRSVRLEVAFCNCTAYNVTCTRPDTASLLDLLTVEVALTLRNTSV